LHVSGKDMIDWLIKMLGFENPNFWNDFWPNFWSTVISGTIFGGILSWIISKSKRTNLEVVLNIGSGRHGNYTLNFIVLNSGNVSFEANEIFWHIYFDWELETAKTMGFTGVVLRNKPFKYFNGSLSLPCFRKSSALCFEIPVKFNKDDIDKLRYYFSLSTSHGYFPKPSIWQVIMKKYDVAPGTTEFVKLPLGQIKKITI
jgi:hypothetical protein